jgi:hypothetical protein
MGFVLGAEGGGGEEGKDFKRKDQIFLFCIEWGFFLKTKPKMDQMGLVHWWVCNLM